MENAYKGEMWMDCAYELVDRCLTNKWTDKKWEKTGKRLVLKETGEKAKLAWGKEELVRMDFANYDEKQGTLKWAVYI